MSDILAEMKHPAIGTREIEEEKREEVDLSYMPVEGDTIIEEEGKKYRVYKTKKTVYGLKTYNDAILL